MFQICKFYIVKIEYVNSIFHFHITCKRQTTQKELRGIVVTIDISFHHIPREQNKEADAKDKGEV